MNINSEKTIRPLVFMGGFIAFASIFILGTAFVMYSAGKLYAVDYNIPILSFALGSMALIIGLIPGLRK